MPRIYPTRTLAILLAALACGDASTPTARIRDSAGTTIVENSANGTWSAATAWKVADTPSVIIGGNETDSTTLLSGVQNATRLGDGRIVVANSASRELRFYSADGKFIKAVGRPGSGPGEFDNLGRALRTDGDTLIVWDYNNGRLSVFDSSGRLARSVSSRSEEAPLFPDPIGRASDGSVIARIAGVNFDLGLVSMPAYFVRYAADLQPVDTIAQRPGLARFISQCGPDSQCAYAAPFAADVSAAFFRDQLYVGTGERFEISVFRVDGTLVRSIRLGVPNRDVTSADVDRQRATVRADARDPARRAELERVFMQMKVPKHMPAFRDLHVDRGGHLWVENYRVTDDEPPRWAVFDSAGQLLGTLGTPRAFRIDEINDDHLLGVYRDSLDVEQVRVYPISRPRTR